MKNARNIALAIAMALVAVIAIVAVITVVKTTPADIAPSMTGNVTVTTTWSKANQFKTEHIEIPVDLEPETKVLLVDGSGSMDGTVYANAGYDEIIVFSDYLGQPGGNSQIAKNTVLALDMGIKELGLVSDLESYPIEDLNSFEGKFYKNRELYVFVPADVEEQNLAQYREMLTNSLEEETSTLIFVFPDGRKNVIFDNYLTAEKRIVETDVEVAPEKIIPDINVNDDRALEPGNYLAPSYVRDIWIAFITTVAMLVEVILALLLLRGEKEPDWVKKVIQTGNIALDGSGSVSIIYADMIKYLKAHKKQVKKIWRFADTIEKLSLAEAAKKKASGQTHGWECLKQMQESGISELTLMSDMQFNDVEETGLHFRKIVFIVPGAHDSSKLDKLKGICDICEVISL
ncbi:MAG: hypothetical protein IJ629_04470 [Clostridia bacterium]|nr:hypothetical protein [Clostridia bacterium]